MVSSTTRDRLKEAALELFREHGFARTSIGAIESAAGLVPRAGAFYRYFESKRALLEEIAKTSIAETPEEFDFAALKLYGDTRAELITIAQVYAKAVKRQAPYARLIEEYRLLEGAKELEEALNERMLEALVSWIATKRLARGRSAPELSALALTVFGSWLFYLEKLELGLELETLSTEFVLDQWASFWSQTLDGTSV
jgi:AcrR family transcriptional regulator